MSTSTRQRTERRSDVIDLVSALYDAMGEARRLMVDATYHRALGDVTAQREENVATGILSYARGVIEELAGGQPGAGTSSLGKAVRSCTQDALDELEAKQQPAATETAETTEATG